MSSDAKLSTMVSDSFEEDPDIIAEEIAFQDASMASERIEFRDPILSTTLHNGPTTAVPYRLIPLNLQGNTFVGTAQTASLLQEIGGGDAIRRMTNLFYLKCFRDQHIAKFIQDESLPHGDRLGNWIVEKMTGEGQPWTMERVERAKCPMHVTLGNGADHVVHDRTSAHQAAWFSPRRPASEMGDRFKVHDARVWMRLMFWSAREVGILDISPTFEHWFTRFIAHFIAVYERAAPQFASDAMSWSSLPTNIDAYVEDGFWMTDVLGRRFK